MVIGREPLPGRLIRVHLGGPALARLQVHQPASSVRLLVPDPAEPALLSTPDWDGNRFVGPDGSRPPLRTMTPCRGAGPEELILDVVVHGDGLASRWAATAEVGSPAAVSGPARGHDIEPGASDLVFAGDETAYGAVCSLVEAADPAARVRTVIETPAGEALPLPAHPGLLPETVPARPGLPGVALVARIGDLDLSAASHLWVAGEAAAMQQLRKLLHLERGLDRRQAVVRGYWKAGRSSDEESEEGSGRPEGRRPS